MQLLGLLVLCALLIAPGLALDCACDVLLLLERSDAVGAQNFEELRAFAQRRIAATGFTDSSGMRIGVIVFSDTATVACSLTHLSATLQTCVTGLSYTGGVTNTHLAFDAAHARFTAVTPSTKCKTVELVTAATPASDVTSSRNAILALGASITAVGIDPATPSDVQALASTPKADHWTWAQTFPVLGTVGTVLGHQCDVLTAGATAQWDTCHCNVALLLDASNGVDYAAQVAFAETRVASTYFSGTIGGMNVSVFNYSDTARLQCDLSNSEAELLACLATTGAVAGSPDVEAAVSDAAAYLRDADPHRCAVLELVVANPLANLSRAAAAVEAAHAQNITVIAIGVERALKPELQALASPPAPDHYTYQNSPAALTPLAAVLGSHCTEIPGGELLQFGTASVTPTPTFTPTDTATASTRQTVTPLPTATSSPTATQVPTETVTAMPTSSPTRTLTPTPTVTGTRTPTKTWLVGRALEGYSTTDVVIGEPFNITFSGSELDLATDLWALSRLPCSDLNISVFQV